MPFDVSPAQLLILIGLLAIIVVLIVRSGRDEPRRRIDFQRKFVSGRLGGDDAPLLPRMLSVSVRQNNLHLDSPIPFRFLPDQIIDLPRKIPARRVRSLQSEVGSGVRPVVLTYEDDDSERKTLTLHLADVEAFRRALVPAESPDGDFSPRFESAAEVRGRLYYYAAHVTAVYDGDTVTVDMDLGIGIWKRSQRIRLWKIDAPEVRGQEREEGLKTRDYLRELILDQDILLRTILDKRGVDRTGKFGRLLGEILLEVEDGSLINVNRLLIDEGLAGALDEKGSPIVTQQENLSSGTVDCRLCGQTRQIHPDSGRVERCPNCLDPAYNFDQR